jgi:hypothetical protein
MPHDVPRCGGVAFTWSNIPSPRETGFILKLLVHEHQHRYEWLMRLWRSQVYYAHTEPHHALPLPLHRLPQAVLQRLWHLSHLPLLQRRPQPLGFILHSTVRLGTETALLLLQQVWKPNHSCPNCRRWKSGNCCGKRRTSGGTRLDRCNAHLLSERCCTDPGWCEEMGG